MTRKSWLPKLSVRPSDAIEAKRHQGQTSTTTNLDLLLYMGMGPSPNHAAGGRRRG